MHEFELEHIDDVAVERAVDAVADRAGHGEHRKPALPRRGELMAHERPHNDDAERREQRKEQPPSAREHAEGDAAVADVCEMDNAGDQRALLRGRGVERNVPHDPCLERLIRRDDRQRGEDIPDHGFFLSCHTGSF